MSTPTLKRLVIVAIALTATPALSTPKNDKAEVCALGARIVAEQARRDVTAFDGQDAASAQFLQDVSRRAEPPLSKAEWALLRRAPQNLFARCPDLTTQLPAGTRMATPEDLAAVQKITRLEPLFIGVIQAPLITPDGRRALVYQSIRCAGLCGDGSLTAYRRVDGRWVQDRVIFRFVS
ncbi:MAG: hypothetical protein AB1542_01265 [Pseudomonadota bacterium]|jgi:hypothetical protein